MTLLILYGVLAVAVSFLCSMLEACLLSIPRSYLESLAERGSKYGKRLREMKNNIDRPLAAILTLNTIAHTVGATGVGAQAAIVFGSASVGIASAVMTLLILVVSEIIPKTLGAVHARLLAIPAAMILKPMIIMCLPIIIPLEWINRLIGYQRKEESLSRAELLATIRLGQASGAIRDREFHIVNNLVMLSSIRLQDVLTPRMVVFSLPAEKTVRRAVDDHYPLRFARIPVYEGARDNVIGYVHRFDIHAALTDGREEAPLGSLVQNLPILPETATVGSALDIFTKNRQQIARVVDEYGAYEGIVTLEDLLESLIGEEIIDETDTVEDMQELARMRRAARHPEERTQSPETGSD